MSSSIAPSRRASSPRCHARSRRRVERRLHELIDATPELASRDEIAFPYDTAMFAFRKT